MRRSKQAKKGVSVYETALDIRDAGEGVAALCNQPGAPADQSSRLTTVEVEVRGRWDALALSELLIPFHSFLVQHDRERWVVHARAPGCHGEQLSDALEAIEAWHAEQGSPRTASCRVGGRPYQLRETKVVPRGAAEERSS
jgi:hypothetical protein